MTNITVLKRENDWAVIYEGLVYNTHPTEIEAISECETLNEVYKMLNEFQVFIDQTIMHRFDDATISLFKRQFDLDYLFI